MIRRGRMFPILILAAALLALLLLPGCIIGTLLGFAFFLITLPFKIIIPLLKAILTLGQKALPYVLLYGLFTGAPPDAPVLPEGVPPAPAPLMVRLDPGLALPAQTPTALLDHPFGTGGRADLVLAVPLASLRDEASRRALADRLQACGGSWRVGPTADLVSLLRQPDVLDRLIRRWLGEGATVVMGGPAGILGPGDPLPAALEPAGRLVRDLPLDPKLVEELERRGLTVEPRGVWTPSRRWLPTSPGKPAGP